MIFQKRPHRLICLALALIITAVFMGAGQYAMNANPSINNEDTLPDDVKIENVERTNLMGYEFVMSVTQLNTLLNQSDEEVKTNWRQRIESVEKYFNCKITITERDDSNKFRQDFSAASANNEKYADIIEMNITEFESLYQTGFLAPFEEIQEFSKYKNKWDNSALIVRNDKTYALSPNTWYFREYANIDGLLFYNSDLLQQHGILDPQEQLERGEWVWGSLYEMLMRLSSEFDQHGIYGLDAPGYLLEQVAFRSNNCRDVIKTDNKFSFGLNNPDAVSSLEFISQMIIDNENIFKNSEKDDLGGDHVDEMMASFKEGKTAFLIGSSEWIFNQEYLNSTGVNWKLVPFPKNYSLEDYNSLSLNNDDTTVFCLSASNPDKDKSFLIWNTLTEELSTTDKDEFFEADYFKDLKTYEIYKNCLSAAQYNYLPILGESYTNAVYYKGVMESTRKNLFSPQEALKNCETNAELLIDRYMNGEIQY